MKSKLLPVWLLIIMSTPMSACGISGGPFEGRIFNEATGEPITGAYAVVTWEGSYNSPVDSQSTCYYVATAISDDQGHFYIDRWTSENNGAGITNRHVVALAYKPGYKMADSYFPDKLAMVPFEGSDSERLNYIASYVDLCGTDGDAENINHFNRVVYSDAQSLADSKVDRDVLEFMLFKVEIGEYGYKEAEQRYLTRAKQDDR